MDLVAYCFFSAEFAIRDCRSDCDDSGVYRHDGARFRSVTAAHGPPGLFGRRGSSHPVRLSGQWMFRLLGITLPAFQIAGSVLLLRIALDMLYAKRSAAQETREETEAGATKDDIAITPLGVPMLAGPGATSTSLILMNQAWWFRL